MWRYLLTSAFPPVKQMTDARCQRCMEFKVGLRDIIHAGHGDRYQVCIFSTSVQNSKIVSCNFIAWFDCCYLPFQLECGACGNSWFASRDEASLLTIEAPDSKKSVGTAPSAATKVEDVEKKLASTCESEKSANEIKKTSEAHIPVWDAQKSFCKSRNDDNIEATKHAD